MLDFLVSWFLDFLVSEFLGFKVSWFQSFLVSKFESSKDFTSISLQFHFDSISIWQRNKQRALPMCKRETQIRCSPKRKANMNLECAVEPHLAIRRAHARTSIKKRNKIQLDSDPNLYLIKRWRCVYECCSGAHWEHQWGAWKPGNALSRFDHVSRNGRPWSLKKCCLIAHEKV